MIKTKQERTAAAAAEQEKTVKDSLELEVQRLKELNEGLQIKLDLVTKLLEKSKQKSKSKVKKPSESTTSK